MQLALINRGMRMMTRMTIARMTHRANLPRSVHLEQNGNSGPINGTSKDVSRRMLDGQP
jgi:hypothetical protein